VPGFDRRSAQIADQTGQVHFCVASLEAALERGSQAALGLGITRALAEEIGITTLLADGSSSFSSK